MFFFHSLQALLQGEVANSVGLLLHLGKSLRKLASLARAQKKEAID